jgi:hypothetical protein
LESEEKRPEKIYFVQPNLLRNAGIVHGTWAKAAAKAGKREWRTGTV